MPTLLIIDDSPTIREIIKVYLMNRAFEFHDAESGERGLNIARIIPVDLIIADVKMPGMDGLQLTREIRADKNPKLRKVPIILLTGEKSEDLRAQGMQAGANAFLQKPVTSGKLKELVMQLLPEVKP